MNKCNDCKYCGGETMTKNNTHFCNNTKSIYKVCLENATACEKFELNAKSDENELRRYAAKVINRGNCMMCGKELTEGLFFCKECEKKAESEE